MPSVSPTASQVPSMQPSPSPASPSSSSDDPDDKDDADMTAAPTFGPSSRPSPRPSSEPTISAAPSMAPSVSAAPSVSMAPSVSGATLNQEIVVISVIDEAVGFPDVVTDEIIENDWKRFRDDYPERKFCLLQPKGRIKRDLKMPDDFVAEVKNGISIFSKVNRDKGDESQTSDWFQLCGLEGLRQSGISAVALFVDTSGSLSGGQVQASYNLFLGKLAANNLQLLDAVQNEDENWVLPHIIDYAA
jgi:hypothetical protein